MGIDITERKKAEKALKESEEKYRYLFNNNPALIIIWDAENYGILEVNDVALAQYGYTRDEFLSMTIMDYRPQEDWADVKDFTQKLLKGGQNRANRNWRHLKKNGELLYMDITSHLIDYDGRKAVLSLAKDITNQILAEKQLQESYEDIRRLNSHLQTVRRRAYGYIARDTRRAGAAANGA